MKIETLGTLVDTRDLFQALAEARSGNVPKEAQAFLLFKLRETCKAMRATAKHVEDRLDSMTPPSPRKKAPRKKV